MRVFSAKAADIDEERSIFVNADENKQTDRFGIDISMVSEDLEGVIVTVDYDRTTGKMMVCIYAENGEQAYRKELNFNAKGKAVDAETQRCC